jgi:hypothetical protein
MSASATTRPASSSTRRMRASGRRGSENDKRPGFLLVDVSRPDRRATTPAAYVPS